MWGEIMTGYSSDLLKMMLALAYVEKGTRGKNIYFVLKIQIPMTVLID